MRVKRFHLFRVDSSLTLVIVHIHSSCVAVPGSCNDKVVNICLNCVSVAGSRTSFSPYFEQASDVPVC